MGTIKVSGLSQMKRSMKRIEQKNSTIRMRTLNNMAFTAWSLTQGPGGTIDRAFELRNKFTERSVRFKKANTNLGSFSMTYSVQEYMAVQEFGQNVYNVGHIPTTDARVSKDQKKVISRPKKLSRGNFGRAGSKVRGNRAAYIKVKQAQRAGDKGPFRMEIRGKHGTQEGLYILDRSNSDNPLRMIHNVSKDKVKIKRKPWLRPPALVAAKMGLSFFVQNYQRELKKV